MHVLYFADIRFPLERANGIQTFHTCCALARRGQEVTLVVRPDTVVPERDPFAFYGEPRDDRFRIERTPVIGQARGRRVSWLLQSLRRALAADRSAVVLTRDLGLASILVRFPRRARPPVVYESHGFAPTVGAAMGTLLSTASSASARKQERLARREARVWREAEGYVTITAGLAAELVRLFGPRPAVAVVADGVRLNDGDDRRKFAWHDPPVVGYAGHLYPWKGVDVLLDAIGQLPGVGALIVGGLEQEPDLERMRTRARELGIADRVTFTGSVAPREVPSRLAQMDVLVLPNTATHVSANYTSPLKLFEYMAAGRPIVASDLPSLREVLCDGRNAVLVPPGDATRLASAIRQLIAAPGVASRLAASAQRDVREYSWERRAERLEHLLLAAASASRRAGEAV